jgi:hypothetical protein
MERTCNASQHHSCIITAMHHSTIQSGWKGPAGGDQRRFREAEEVVLVSELRGPVATGINLALDLIRMERTCRGNGGRFRQVAEEVLALVTELRGPVATGINLALHSVRMASTCRGIKDSSER